MNTIIISIGALFVIAVVAIIGSWVTKPESANETTILATKTEVASVPEDAKEEELSPMAIKSLRNMEYPGGDFTIEQTLPNGTNYAQFVVSYLSEGLKIYGLLTVPLATRPEQGYPAVVFIHGHIPPKQYSTINDYPTYQAALAHGGFVTFKPDLRGHGNSEGEPVSAHYSEKYVVDTMNAISYLKAYKDVDKERMGYWGHSNGGEIGLRVALISKDIKASSLWAGVVGSYEDMFETYVEKIPFLTKENPLTTTHGLPSTKSDFWNEIEPYNYLSEINIPIQLQHGTEDKSVPVELSLSLKKALEEQNKDVEYIEYQGDDHNIRRNSGVAWQRTIAFFKENL